MSRFTACLWKEWREHRGLALAIALAFPALTLAFELLAPSSLEGRGALPNVVALLAFATVSLALFGEVFAGEERRGTIEFLRRQPGGWEPPFAAKFVFLAAATLAITGASWGCAALVGWGFHGVTPDALAAKNGEEIVELLVLVPLWSVVVSIAWPRSSIALPAAAFVLLAFAAPIAFACIGASGASPSQRVAEEVLRSTVNVLRPTRAQFAWALRLLVVAAPVVAALSFARGRMVERRRWRAAAIGIVATLALFTPAYAWTAARVVDYRRFDPSHDPINLVWSQACVSTGGRYAYVNAFVGFDVATRNDSLCAPGSSCGPNHPLQIDLATGAWREVGSIGSTVWPAPDSFQKAATPYVVIEDRSAPIRPPRDQLPEGGRSTPESRVLPLLDADTGEVVRPDLDEAFLSASDEAGARFQRLACALFLPDGSRAWFEHGHLVRCDRDGKTRVLPDSGLTELGPRAFLGRARGHGVFLGDRTFYDVVGERRFDVPEESFVRWIRGGECIVIRPPPDSNRSGPGANPWSRFDPLSREFAPIAGLVDEAGAHESVDEMADDGRLFVATLGTRKDDAPPRLWLLDPESGQREAVELPELVRDWTTPHVGLRGRTPSGVPVMAICDARWQRTLFVRFDLASRSFAVAGAGTSSIELVGVDSEDSIVVTDGLRLLRARFGRSGTELVFPK